MNGVSLSDNVDARGRPVRLRSPMWRTALLWVLVAAVLGTPAALIFDLAPPGSCVSVCAIPLVFGLLLVLAVVEKHGLSDAEVAARLASGFCPNCRYGLQSLRPEEDGCTICPECGAAWRVGGAAGVVSGGEGAGG